MPEAKGFFYVRPQNTDREEDVTLLHQQLHVNLINLPMRLCNVSRLAHPIIPQDVFQDYFQNVHVPKHMSVVTLPQQCVCAMLQGIIEH